jgi:hypothetical protein
MSNRQASIVEAYLDNATFSFGVERATSVVLAVCVRPE